MWILIAGLGIWVVVHLFPSVAPQARQQLIGVIGFRAYTIIFSIDILLSLVLIVVGFRMSPQVWLYAPPLWAQHLVHGLLAIAFIVFFAAKTANNIKRFIRHPQLLGVSIWAVAHLLVNSEVRSVMLFGVLGVWALIEMCTISRRTGSWIRPDPVPFYKDIRHTILALAAYGVVVWLHPWLFGVAVVGA